MDGQPYVLPNAYGRVGERLYFHGSITNRTFKSLQVSCTANSAVLAFLLNKSLSLACLR